MSESIVYPEDVQIETVTREFYRGVGQPFSCADEAAARYYAATHTRCDCGEPVHKPYIACDTCFAARTRQRWEALEPAPEDYDGMVFEFDGDEIFDSIGEAVEWAKEQIAEELDREAGWMADSGAPEAWTGGTISERALERLAIEGLMLVDADPDDIVVDIRGILEAWYHGPDGGCPDPSPQALMHAELLQQQLRDEIGPWFKAGKRRIVFAAEESGS